MKKTVRLLTVLTGSFLFFEIFWDQNLGINTLIYSVLIYGISLYLYPEILRNKSSLLAIGGNLISAVLVVLYNSGTSKFAFICSFIVATGFIFRPQFRSVLFSLLAGITNYFAAQAELARHLFSGKKQEKEKIKRFRHIKIIFFPLIILTAFIIIFKIANPVFDDYTIKIGIAIGDFFRKLFVDITIYKVLFLFLGFLITTGAIYYRKISFFINKENKFKTDISNKQIKDSKLNKVINESKTAIILFVTINILLLIINIIDIDWIWLNFTLDEGISLTQLVHEGTYMLIFSILLSMAIVIYYFRSGLNFIKNNRFLKIAAYLWMFQNIILAVSVAIRNMHYISYYGLAYKRIGVFIFLLITLAGIITIFIKIHKRKSGFYLVKINSLSLYIVMILISAVSWDIAIAKYNLKQDYKAGIDEEFIFEMTDKALPLIYKNKEKLSYEGLKKLKKKIYNLTYNESDFWSYNYPEYKARQYFINDKK